MRLLLDTHILLWWCNDDPALSRNLRQAIAAPDADVFVSSVSLWEIAIKSARGRLQFPIERIDQILADCGFEPLPITMLHARTLAALPLLHLDPFDRMLIAQAQSEALTLISVDDQIARYNLPLLKV